MFYRIKKIGSAIIKHIFLIFIATACIAPFVWMINSSLQTEKEFSANHGLVPAKSFYLSNYKEAILREGLWVYFLNSCLYTASTVALIVLFSALAGYAFSRLKFWGKNVIFIMFLSAMMIPLPAGFVPVYVLLNKLHLINRTGYVLAMSNMGLSFSIYMFKTFFDQIPNDIEEAARIDGCNRLQIWWHVAIPLVKPAMVVVVVFNALNVWNEFVLASLIFTEKSQMPLQAGLMDIYYRNIISHTLVMAALTIAALPVIFLYLRMQKQFIKGLTAGAIVG